LPAGASSPGCFLSHGDERAQTALEVFLPPPEPELPRGLGLGLVAALAARRAARASAAREPALEGRRTTVLIVGFAPFRSPSLDSQSQSHGTDWRDHATRNPRQKNQLIEIFFSF